MLSSPPHTRSFGPARQSHPDRVRMAGGLSLIEIVVAISIVSILAGAGFFAFASFRASTFLNGAQDTVIAALKLARSRSVASDGALSWGVHFDANQVVVFVGPTYSAGTATNSVSYLPQGIEAVNVDVPAPPYPDITFARLSGAAQSTGRVRVRMLQNPSRSRDIAIRTFSDLIGSTELPEQNPAARLTDTRHVHFDLGWSLQSATQLILTFTANRGPQVETVDMTPFFSGGPPATSFSWSGTYTIDGMPQSLRIHTHLLSGSNTILSIHRNRMENTKALNVSFNTTSGLRNVATYTSDGTLNDPSSPFVVQ